MENELRDIPLNHALIKEDHLWGCERRPILLVTMFSIIFIILSGFDFKLISFGVALWVFGNICLRITAKADPFASSVYLKHVKYQEYYSTTSTPFCVKQKVYK